MRPVHHVNMKKLLRKYEVLLRKYEETFEKIMKKLLRKLLRNFWIKL